MRCARERTDILDVPRQIGHAVPSSPSADARFPWIGLLTLAGAIFVSVTSEFLPTGLLPDMAADLDVSLSTAGLLVTVFAATVVIATTPLAAITRSVDRKFLVVLVLFVIALANVLAAVAPTYELLVGARILCGLAHGLFWAVVAAYSAHLVPPHQLGRAVAVTAAGGSAAFVLGVPVGTALGHALSWRAAFGVIAAVVAVLAIVVMRFLPAVEHRVPLATGEIPVPARRDRSFPSVLLLCGVILVMITGQNTFYTYITPWLVDVAGFSSDTVAFLLFLFGGAGAVGLIVAGFTSDRFPRRSFAVAVVAIMITIAVLAAVSGNAVVVVVAFVVWGVAFGGMPAMLQTRMLHTASARIRDLAAALQTTAFNVGIGGGALLGGVVLDRTGLASLPAAAIALYAAGFLVHLVADALRGARQRRSA